MTLREVWKILETKSVQEELEMSGEQILEQLKKKGILFENIYQELEMTSLYVDTHEDVSYAEDVVQLHSHSFYEILYCSKGNVQYLLGSERYRIQKGDILMIPPGVGHQPFGLKHLVEPYQRYVIWISMDFIHILDKLWAGVEKETGCYLLRTTGTQWEYLVKFFRDGCREAEQKVEGWQAYVCGNTVELLVHLRRAFLDETRCIPLIEEPELFDKILSYIESHMAEKITLGNTAKRFLVSKSTISQLFNKKLGTSFYRYVIQRRLIAAKIKILAGEPLEILCGEVGFCDYSTFYRAFKQEYGISPIQFRKLQIDME